MGEPAIDIENLSYQYEHGFLALKNINLKIRNNEFVGIIGQNGAGKSTLLKNITGLLKPTKGEIRVKGVDTRDITVADLATKVGFVLQNPDRQLFSQTVKEEVAFGPINLGLSEAETESRVNWALKEVGLESMSDHFPPALSKGDRAKVIIASVLAMQPDIIILDEPTSGQDYRGCYQIMDIAKQLHTAGHTVVVVTHHMALVAEYTCRTIVMCEGSILMDASTREVFSQPEKLRQTHIKPPQITELGHDLSKLLDIKDTILDIKEMGDIVLDRCQVKVRAGAEG